MEWAQWSYMEMETCLILVKASLQREVELPPEPSKNNKHNPRYPAWAFVSMVAVSKYLVEVTFILKNKLLLLTIILNILQAVFWNYFFEFSQNLNL